MTGISPDQEHPRSARARSLATKFTLFTTALVFWVIAISFGYHIRQVPLDFTEGVLLLTVVLLVSGAIVRFTMRVLAMPLKNIEAGVACACKGQFVPIQVRNTGDEIEALSHGVNRIVMALAAANEEIQRNQDLMEDRIRRRTESLEKAVRKAESDRDAKSNFLMSSWRELAAPLDGIRATIDILLQGSNSPENRQRLDDVRRSACSLLSLANDLRDYAEMEAGKLTLHKVPFDARALVQGCVRAHQPVPGEGLEIRCEIAPDIPREVVGDPLRLRQYRSRRPRALLAARVRHDAVRAELVATLNNRDASPVGV